MIAIRRVGGPRLAELDGAIMLYSQACSYAIRAMTYLARQPAGRKCFLSEIASVMEIPEGFSSKILTDLVKAGLLESHKGINGGYQLARSPDEITLLSVKQQVDSETGLDRCVAGWGRCPHPDCAIHARWMPIRRRVRAFLEETTLADLATAYPNHLSTPNEEASHEASDEPSF